MKIAPADVPVLVTGPNGAGKERLADIVQANSRRASGPYVKVSAGALPHDLIESELFGAEAGAFTGATRTRAGRFEAAHGGTLFLDEIGTLPPDGQVKLLRVLQSGTFERLGSNQTRRVDVRVVCATNADLPLAIREGRFREDLYFRLNVVELAVPALRDRADDILPLASALLAAFAAPRPVARAVPRGRARAPFARVARQRPRAREPRAARPSRRERRRPRRPRRSGSARPRRHRSSAARSDAAERAALEALIVRHAGRVSQAAEELGLSRQAFYRRMERLGITLERRPRD